MFAAICITVVVFLVYMPKTQKEEDEMKGNEKRTKKPKPQIIIFNPPGRTCCCEDYPCCGH